MENQKIKEILNNNVELRKDLFIRGFLIVDKDIDINEFPFYGNWRKKKIENYYFLSHYLT